MFDLKPLKRNFRGSSLEMIKLLPLFMVIFTLGCSTRFSNEEWKIDKIERITIEYEGKDSIIEENDLQQLKKCAELAKRANRSFMCSSYQGTAIINNTTAQIIIGTSKAVSEDNPESDRLVLFLVIGENPTIWYKYYINDSRFDKYK